MRIYLYGVPPGDQELINDLLARQGGTAAVRIPLEWSDTTVSEVLEGRGRPGVPPRVDPPVVLFHQATDEEIQTFIGAFSELRRPDPIWAAVTPANLDWTVTELYTALREERRALEEGAGPEEPVV